MGLLVTPKATYMQGLLLLLSGLNNKKNSHPALGTPKLHTIRGINTMKLEDIYESFFDTYRNVGYIISELSQRTLRRASAVAKETSDMPLGAFSSERDGTASKLNREKLRAQSERFKDAADKKAKESERRAAGAPTGKPPGHEDEETKKSKSRFRRASMVNRDLKLTQGFESREDKDRSVAKAYKDSRDRERLRKRFKGELDG